MIYRAVGPAIGITSNNISARSLCSGEAVDLLLPKVDPDTIRLMGRWRSNRMICYLHTTKKNFTYGLSVHMLQHGNYVLIPPMHVSF